MNDIRDLLPNRMRERTFQLKAKRDAGAVWHEPQFVECKQCGRRAARTLWGKSLYVCPNCGYHMPIGGYYRLSLVLDHGSFRELDADLDPQDVLNFPGYGEKLAAAQNKTGLHEAAVTAVGRIGGVACVAAVLDSRFFMGSMSTAVGEKITRAVEYATAKRLPLVIFSASGGALALGVANHILMLENAVYSVLSPEGFASILWKDSSRSGEACEMMKLTAQDLYRGGIVEEVIPEPVGGAQRCHAALFERMDAALRAHLKELCRMSDRQLADQRYKKYRQIGETRNA